MSSLAFRSFDPLFADPFRMARAFFDTPSHKASAPLSVRVDVTETAEAFEFEADLPGVREDDVEVTVDGRTLAISGTRERKLERDTDNQHIVERSFGKFTRSFLLPETADVGSIHADLSEGVLHVRVGKKAEVKPRKITVGKATTGELPKA